MCDALGSNHQFRQHFFVVGVDNVWELFDSDEASDNNHEEGNEVNALSLNDLQSKLAVRIKMRNKDINSIYDNAVM